MISFKNPDLKVYVFFFIFLAGVVFLVFNESGILKYLKLRNEVNDLNKKIENLQKENKGLEAEIDSLLRKEPAKIERIAREKYNMQRPNEKSIQVIEN